MSDKADLIIGVLFITQLISSLLLSYFIIKQMAKRANLRNNYIYPFLTIYLPLPLSFLIAQWGLKIHEVFPIYVDSWLSLRNIAIQEFFSYFFMIISICIRSLLIMYIYKSYFKKALIISISSVLIPYLLYGISSRIASMIFSMVLTGSMSYGPI